MVRYDSYTDSFIDNPTKETTATINLNAIPKDIIQINEAVEVSDASIEKIADAVVRKLTDRKTEPTISKMEQVDRDCTGCKFIGTYDTEFPCANCSRKTKDYYAKDEPQAEIKGSKRLLKGSDEPQTKRPIQCYECRAWHRCFKEKPSYNMIKSRCPIDEPQTEREGE